MSARIYQVSSRQVPGGALSSIRVGPGSIPHGRVFIYATGLVVMSDQRLREMQRQMVKLNESMAGFAGDRVTSTFGEFAQVYLAEKMASPEHRDSTKRATEYQFRRNLVPAFGQIPIDKFGNADWNRWIALMKSDTGRIKQVTRFFNARKTTMELLHAAQDRGMIDRVPRLAQPDERKRVGRVLSDKEVWLILRNTTYRIFRVFFYTMYKMGCRPREILKWEWSMIRLGDVGKSAWIEIPARITKTARARQIPINPTVTKHLLRQLKENPGARFVFQNRIHPDSPQLSYHGAWKTACMKAGIKKAVPYDLRRTKITRDMVAGKPPIYIAKLLDTSVNMIEGVYCKDDAGTMEALVE